MDNIGSKNFRFHQLVRCPAFGGNAKININVFSANAHVIKVRENYIAGGRAADKCEDFHAFRGAHHQPDNIDIISTFFRQLFPQIQQDIGQKQFARFPDCARWR